MHLGDLRRTQVDFGASPGREPALQWTCWDSNPDHCCAAYTTGPCAGISPAAARAPPLARRLLSPALIEGIMVLARVARVIYPTSPPRSSRLSPKRAGCRSRQGGPLHPYAIGIPYDDCNVSPRAPLWIDAGLSLPALRVLSRGLRGPHGVERMRPSSASWILYHSLDPVRIFVDL